MEKTKLCKHCGINKLTTEFTKGKAVCKFCRSSNQSNLNKHKRLKQKTPDVKLQKAYLTEKVNAFSVYLTAHPDVDITYIANQLQDLGDIYEKIVEQMSVIYFPIVISDGLQNYLEQLDDLNYDTNPATAMEILMRTPEPIFIETFGVSNHILSETIEDELDDLKFIIDAITNTNNVLIDEHNKKISRGVSAKERFEYIEADVCLDINVPAITFNNLFHLSKQQAIDKIKEIQDSGNIWVKAFVKNGYFDKFWKLLVSDKN